MGTKSKSKSKTRKQENYIEAKACDICFDTILARYNPSIDIIPDNSISCSNKHQICMECIKKLIKPKNGFCTEDGARMDNCCEFNYTCPMCRESNCVGRSQIYSIMKGSWKVTFKDFEEFFFDDELIEEISQAVQQLST